ncbi:hypothetical protein [Kangiella shandongensis]|uniref:hypothetical protein n=1 Tax=Kangiella shandongensis TaxID=2763258 RepID=UPI001CBF8104|nr:hypothetical protein [Kangiella shandongensis]
MTLSQLPNNKLLHNSGISAQFYSQGCQDFHQACHYVWRLPYGRNSDRADWQLVLKEKKGACSTKHALLKALADELNLPVQLTVGIYKMSERNTPGVGAELKRHGLSYIPEAHCYLRANGQRFDFTKRHLTDAEPIDDFLLELNIKPNHIGDHKVSTHQKFIKQHIDDSNELSHLSFEAVWHIRESCIQALSHFK